MKQDYLGVWRAYRLGTEAAQHEDDKGRSTHRRWRVSFRSRLIKEKRGGGGRGVWKLVYSPTHLCFTYRGDATMSSAGLSTSLNKETTEQTVFSMSSVNPCVWKYREYFSVKICSEIMFRSWVREINRRKIERNPMGWIFCKFNRKSTPTFKKRIK